MSKDNFEVHCLQGQYALKLYSFEFWNTHD